MILVNSQEERKSLTTEPLPISNLANMVLIDYTMVGPDRVLTSIVLIDEQVDQIQQVLQPFIQNLIKQRETLMGRATAEGITEDTGAVLIEKKGKQFRNEIFDLDAFRLSFPEEYEEIRESQEKDIEDKYKKSIRDLEDSKIPLTLADKKIGQEKVTEFVGNKPVSISYEVVRKGGN